MIAAACRRLLWRTVLMANGGFTVFGRLPRGGCVVVANHRSHADTPTLLAGLPASARPAVAAAADYWFATPLRRWICRMLTGAFPVRRGGGGMADLTAAAAHLRTGRVVVVYPEGTRSRTGELGTFHSGAFRLAAAASVPVVPVGIVGTDAVLPVHGDLRRGPVEVRIGSPLMHATPEAARRRVAELAAAPPSRPDSRLRRRVARFATTRHAIAVTAAWGFTEAISWPLIPELLLAVLVVAAPRTGLWLPAVAATASVVGGLVAYALTANGIQPPQPLTTARMHAVVADETRQYGALAVRQQALAGIPYKTYAAEAGAQGVDVMAFAWHSATSRGLRILVVGWGFALLAAALHRLRPFYPTYLVTLLSGFAVGLTLVVIAWN